MRTLPLLLPLLLVAAAVAPASAAAAADLSTSLAMPAVEVGPQGAHADVGVAIRYSATVFSAGPDPAPATSIRFTYAPGLRLRRAVVGGRACAHAPRLRRITCSLGTVTPAAPANADITLVGWRAGRQSVRATATTVPASDPTPANATATVALAVEPNDSGCTILGTPRAERISGTAGDDVMCGLAGNDTLLGLGGDDELRGEGGNDTLRGGAGTNSGLLDGGPGNDIIVADRARANLRGGTGNDRLTGSTYPDTLDGGPGDDVLDGGRGGDYFTAGAGNDVLRMVDGLVETGLAGAGRDIAYQDAGEMIFDAEVLRG